MQPSQNEPAVWHGTTILTVRKGGKVVIGGNRQVSIGQTVMKSNAKKVRKSARATSSAALPAPPPTSRCSSRWSKLQYPAVTRAAVELAKDWRDSAPLSAPARSKMMIVADRTSRS